MPEDEIAIAIRSDLDIVAARQSGRALTTELHFSTSDATLIATAISELARNIVAYAKSGEILLSVVRGPGRQGIEVVARDQGPGIPDVQVALRDGYSTSGGLGLGLPGVKRLADEFQIASRRGRGTTVTFRKWRSVALPPIEWGVAGYPAPGQRTSGDLHVVQPFPGGMLVGALDGIGHGEEAAEAARAAKSTVEAHASEPLIAIVRRCHERLRTTRGVVMSLAAFDLHNGLLAWLGVGNVQGVLLRPNVPLGSEESLLLRAGVVGAKLPSLQAPVIRLVAGDTLVLATDGVRSDFRRELARNLPPQVGADSILALHGSRSDDALVLVVRYLGRVHESASIRPIERGPGAFVLPQPGAVHGGRG